MRFQRQYVAALLAAFFPIAACHGCRPKPSEPDSLERLLPASGATILFVPRLGVALENLHLLTDALGQIPQGELLGQALDQLASQVGGGGALRDLPDAIGLDRARAMAFALTGVEGPTPEYWLALPIKERGPLQARLGKLMASRFDAHEEEGPHGVRRYLRKEGTVAAALRFDERAHGTAFVALGPHADAQLQALLPITADESLARSPDYQACRARWSEMDLWVYLPAGSEVHLASRALKAVRAAGAGFAFGRDGLHARLVVLLSAAQAVVAGSLSGTAGQDLLGLLSPQAALRFQFGGDLSALAASTDLRGALPGPLGVALDEAGIDPRDLLGDLQPGIVLGVGLLERPSFHSMPGLNPRESNPFAFLSLRALARVRDVARAQATLQKIEAAGPRYGVSYRASVVGGTSVQTASYSQGESVSLALVDHTLLVTGGEGEMARALAALAAPVPGSALFPKATVAWQLDLPMLLGEVDAIPASAFGGFAGLTVRSLIARLTAPLGHFGKLQAALFLEGDAAITELVIPLR